MLDHPTIAQAITGLIGLGIGIPLGTLMHGAKIGQLRSTVATLKRQLVDRDQTVSDLTGELKETGDRNSALRLENGELQRKHGRAVADINRLRPHAEAHLASVAQREAALAKAREANAARAAAKASNVEPIERRA